MYIVDRMNHLRTDCHVARIKSLVLEQKWFGYDYTHMLSCFSHAWFFSIPWTAACQAPLSIGFSREIITGMSSSRESSQPRGQTHVSYISCIDRWVFYHYCHLGSPKSSNEHRMYKHGWHTHTHTQILFISRWTNQSMQLLNCDWYVCVCTHYVTYRPFLFFLDWIFGDIIIPIFCKKIQSC